MIAEGKIGALVFQFRASTLRQYGDVDLLTEKERDERLGMMLSEPSDYLLVRGRQPIYKLTRLLQVPRMLKTVLRHTQQGWDRLHGEVDFDDLLVATTIRFAAPEAFDFLLENFRTIRALEHEGIGDERKERLEQLQSKWNQLADKSWDHASIRQLITFLFPIWSTGALLRGGTAPQGVAVSHPTDYWLRLLAGDLGPAELRDQEVIRAIQDWSKQANQDRRDETTLPKALSSRADFADKFEQFAQVFLDGNQLRTLATALFKLMLDQHGVTANHEASPGFIPLWRCAIRKPVQVEEHKRWMLAELLQSLPRSLRFTNEVFYWWGTNDQIEINGSKDRRDVWDAMVQRAKELFESNPKALIGVLDPSFMAVCFHFAGLNSSPKYGGPGFDPKQWAWFRKLLLDAADLDLNTMIPQIALFACREQMTVGAFEPRFDEAEARAFFDQEYERMLRLYRKPIDLSVFPEKEKKFIEVMQQVANGSK